MHDAEYPQDELQRWQLWSHVTFFIITIFIIIGYLLIKDSGLFADEAAHISQISIFTNGRFAMDPSLTTIPGFHLVIAIIGMIVGETSLAFLRFIAMLMSIAGIAACRSILIRTTPQLAVLRLLQVAFLPILFPYFSLLYTDVAALTLVLWGIVFFLDRRYTAALFIVALSILIRQMNIIWFLMMMYAWLTVEHKKILFQLMRQCRRFQGRELCRTVRELQYTRIGIANIVLILIVGILFGTFMVINGGVAIGDQGSHPFPGIHPGNIFFAMGVFTILFLPYVLWTISSIIRSLRDASWTIPALVALFTVYMIIAWNSHYYNQETNSYFIHNRILAFVTSSPSAQLMGFIAVAFGAMSIMVARLQKPWMILLPATLLCLLPSWLIEQRYYIIPYVLFLMLRIPNPLNIERSLALYEAILSGILFWVIASHTLFI